MRRFAVTVERTPSGVWVTECPEVGAVSQVQHPEQAADDLREAIAHLTGLDQASFEIDVVTIRPGG